MPMPTFAYLPLVKFAPSWQLSQRALLEKNTTRPRFWLSVNAARGSWQLAHDTVASPDSRLSKYSSQPSSAFSGLYLLSFGQMIGGSPRGTAGPSFGNGGAGSAAEKRYANAPMQTTAASPATTARRRVRAIIAHLGNQGSGVRGQGSAKSAH